MTGMLLLDALFRRRGLLLGVAAILFGTLGAPSRTSIVTGSLLALTGLTLRLWAISWIGPAARTRDPSPPAMRIKGGPYRLRHPLYGGNILVGVGFAWASSPPLTALTLGSLGLVVFYVALAAREELSLRRARVPAGVRPRLGIRGALRTERSTWGTAVIALSALAMLAYNTA